MSIIKDNVNMELFYVACLSVIAIFVMAGYGELMLIKELLEKVLDSIKTV